MAEVDTVELTSNIGTWVAAAVAVVALVGVVGPYLALQASFSDRNRAMNAVQDDCGKYVTRGYRVTRGMRAFRRIRVPNLAPSYIANEPEATTLVPPAATRGVWTIRSTNYQSFNTGWAKLAQLIEAYQARDLDADADVDLHVPRDGTLEIVNSRTALVVSKHWILLLGLLGRYGKRSDKGVLYEARARRDSYSERRLTRKIKKDWADANSSSEDSKGGELLRYLSGYRAGTEATEDSSANEEDDMTVRRNEYGEWIISKRRNPVLYGITGTMQALGRQKGSWSYLTSIAFVPRTETEMFPRQGPKAKRDVASVEALFWLAQGYLPCGVEADGRRVVISLEDPDSGLEDVYTDFSADNLHEQISVFDLQEADDVKLPTGNALRSFGLADPKEPKVLRLLPYDRDSNMMQTLTSNIRPAVDPGSKATARVFRSTVAFTDMENESVWIFPRSALEKPIGVFLSLDWDPWGFVVRHGIFFSTLLSGATEILSHKETLRSKTFWEGLAMSQIPLRGFRHDVSIKFRTQVLRHRIALDEGLSACLKGSTTLPLKLSLGALFILDDDFRKEVDGIIPRLVILGSAERSEESRREAVDKVRVLKEKLVALQEQHARRKADSTPLEREAYVEAKRAEDDHERRSFRGFGIDPPAQRTTTKRRRGIHSRNREPDSATDIGGTFQNDPSLEPRPFFTRFAMNELDLRTVKAFGMDHTDEDNAPYILVEGRLPEWEVNLMWEHTKTLRELGDASEFSEIIQGSGSLEYKFSSKKLTWPRGESDCEGERVLSWTLGEELLRVSGAEAAKTIKIEEKDLLLVALWVANRAAMWIGSLDSEPLLSFVDDLDSYVYVM